MAIENSVDGRLLVIGDSLAWGAWDEKFHGWVNRLQLILEKRGEYKYEIFNLGIGGEHSRDMLKRIDCECKARLATDEAKRWFSKKENVIIIEVGKNDARIENNKAVIPEKEFEKNLEKIVKIARKYANHIYFTSCAGPIDETKTTPLDDIVDLAVSYTNESAQKYSKIIEKVCRQNKVGFIDIYTPLKKAKNVLSDGLHLNERGHQVVAETVEKALIKAGFIKS
ncbi:MAG: GDSL-type esterase/lipase family protein [Candidatus Micrarchaeota archaeon]